MNESGRRHILVVGLHSTRNVGDAVLLEAAVQQLRHGFPDCFITLAMNDTRYIPTQADVAVVASITAMARPYGEDGGTRWHFGHLLAAAGAALVDTACRRAVGRHWPLLSHEQAALHRAYAEADLVVCCPGNVFFTMGRFGLPFLCTAAGMAQALALGKPLYVMPQTVGPFTRERDRRIARAILSRARLVYVREPTSVAVLESLGLGPPLVRLVPDLAFAYRPDTGSQAEDVLAHYGLLDRANGPYLGVTVVNRMLRRIPESTWRSYEAAVAAAVSGFLDRHGGRAVFFPQVTGPTVREDDRVAARRVVEQMPSCRDRAVMVDELMPPASLYAAYGAMDLFLATRMHSAIFAISAAVPTLAIEYLGKTEGMMRMAGMERWVLRLAELEGHTLLSRLEDLYAGRNEEKQRLTAVVPELAARASGVGEAIAKDFA